MPYQRGQYWVRRFMAQAVSLPSALAELTAPVEGPDFSSKAIQMLERIGWIVAHRFLFSQLRAHLLGWPPFLAPCGIRSALADGVRRSGSCPQSTCIVSESEQT